MAKIVPAQYQPPLPLDKLILQHGAEGAGDRMELDVLIVGAGPAGLACAIALAKLAKADGTELNIGVLEKAEALGEHSLSGAVINPRAFRELFPDLRDADFPFRRSVVKEAVYLLTTGSKWRLPTPPSMRNHGNYVASLCEVVRWLGAKAEELGVNVFTGFPAAQLLVRDSAVAGVRTAPAGLDREGKPAPGGTPPNDLVAKVTALAEGTRGSLAQAWCQWQRVPSENPQVFALGVKELWETKQPLDRVIHTMGWPLPSDAFGGSFVYPLEPNLVALGLVVGLDYHDAALDVHVLLQRFKQHPLLRALLAGGEMVEWGAKTIPEGGFYSVPERRSGDGVVLLGDVAGFVDVPSLKGIHYVGVRSPGERVVCRRRSLSHAQHAAGVPRRFLLGRDPSSPHDADARAVPRWEVSDACGCGRRQTGIPGLGPGVIRDGERGQQSGRGIQVREFNERYHPQPSDCSSGCPGRGRPVLLPRLPRGRVRSGGGWSPQQRTELRGL